LKFGVFGIAQLSFGNSSNPIAEFNQQFNRMRERRKLTPVTEDLPECSYEGVMIAGKVVDTEEQSDREREGEQHNSQSDNDDNDSDANQWINPEMEISSPTLECVNEDDVALDMAGN
jgi:hypothetical protein